MVDIKPNTAQYGWRPGRVVEISGIEIRCIFKRYKCPDKLYQSWFNIYDGNRLQPYLSKKDIYFVKNNYDQLRLYYVILFSQV